jgi:PAS domain S-box-containing protein
MENSNKNSAVETIRQKAEELLKKKSEAEILELVHELTFQNEEKAKRADELVIANNELAFQNQEKAKRADELSVANANSLKLTHELKMHQLELEMRNKELSCAKEQAETDALKYAELYDFAPSGYFTLSKDGTIAEVNISGATMLGKDRSQLKNNRFGFFVSKGTRTIFNLFLDKAFNSNANESCDVTLSSIGKLPMYVHLTGIIRENREQCFVTAIDITHRKRIENELKLSETKFRTLFESANDAIFIMNNKVFRGCNTKTEIVFGCGPEDIIGHPPADFSPLMQPDGRLSSEKSAEKIHAALAGNPQLFYWQHQHYDGTLFDAEVSLNKVEIDGEECLQAIVRDISERILAENALKESEEKYRLLAEHMTDIVWLMDMDFRVTYQSPSSEKLRGFNSQEIQILPMEKNLTPESLKLALESFSSQMQKIETNQDYLPLTTMELEYYCKDGTTIWLENNFSLIRDDNGHPMSILGEGRDITERRQAEEKIHELNRDLELRVKLRTAELETANKELETFSYSISHDLKAPLRHITGFINLFLESKPKEISKEQLAFLDVISSSAKDMGKLIDGILNFSKLNAIELQKTTIRSSELVQQVIKFFDTDIQNRKITFNVEPLPEVKGDEELIRQVWINLMSNAIKYTMKIPEPVIEIGSISTGKEITFNIKDNGAGFDMKYAEKLFGVFQRLHKSSDFEGVGIGLANVNRIVTRHGGHCSAEGEADKGATFSFTLPIYD